MIATAIGGCAGASGSVVWLGIGLGVAGRRDVQRLGGLVVRDVDGLVGILGRLVGVAGNVVVVVVRRVRALARRLVLGDDLGDLVLRRGERLDGGLGLLHPLVSREYLTWREQLATLDEPPLVAVTEVPLLYEVGSQDRFDKVVVVTAPRQLREQRRRVPRDDRDARLLPDREKVRRADYHYVNTGTFEDLHAWVGEVASKLEGEAATLA